MDIRIDQFFAADWKMKSAIREPASPVTAKAAIGRGLVSPKFCKFQINKHQSWQLEKSNGIMKMKSN